MTTAEHNNHQLPCLYRSSSTHRLKACYQRNMLLGLLGAVLLVGIPGLVLAWWPSGDEQLDAEPAVPPDTVRISLPLNRQIEIVSQQPVDRAVVILSGIEGSVGSFVDEVVAVPDSPVIDDAGGVFGPGGGRDIMPYPGDPPGWSDLGGDSVVFVPDTTVYDLSAELDRIPRLVAMEEPEYPSIARRVGAEGTVILQVRVGADGFVEDAEAVTETNPGYGFGRAAVEAAWTAVFVPALYKDQPVRCLVRFPVEFVLTE